MSVITPTGDGGTLPPVLSGTTGTGGSSGSTSPLPPTSDSLGSASDTTVLTNFSEHPDLDPPQLSLSEYFTIVRGALRTSVENLKQIEAEEPLAERNLSINLAQNAEVLLADLYEITKAVNTYNSLQAPITQEISTVNQAIAQYNQTNGLDQTNINNLNSAITNYNSALHAYQDNPTPQNYTLLEDAYTNLQTAESDYNAYQTSRGNGPTTDAETYNAAVTEFDNQAATFNTQLTTINSERASLGIPPLSTISSSDLPPTANAAGLPNAPSIGSSPPLTPVQTVQNTNPLSISSVQFTPSPQESLDTILNTYYAPLVAAFQAQFNKQIISGKQYLNVYNVHSFLLPNNKNHYIANTYKEYQPPASSSSAGAGAGASVGNMVTNLNPNQAIKALINGVTQQLNTLSSQNKLVAIGNVHAPSALKDYATLFGLDILGKNALLSVIPSLKILANQVAKLGVDNAAVGATYSLALANNLFTLAGTNAVKQAFENYISQVLGKSFSGSEELASQLASSFNLSIIQFGLANIASAFQLPGLVPQAVANVSGLPADQIQVAASPNPTLSETLQNPVTLANLSSNLTSQLAKNGGFSTEQSQVIVNNALATTTGQLGRYASYYDIRRSLEQQFQSANVDGATSRQLVNQALDTLQADRVADLDAQSQNANFNTNRDLRDQITANAINQGQTKSDAVAAANQQIQNFNFSLINQGALQASLQFQLQNEGVQNASNLATTIAHNLATATSISSETQLRELIRSDLIQSNISHTVAKNVAEAADIQLTNIQASSNANALKTSGLQQTLTPAQLADQLKSSAVQFLSPDVGNDLAVDIGNQLANVVVGGGYTNLQHVAQAHNPNSFINRANEAVIAGISAGDANFAQNNLEAFREFMKPNINFNTIADSIRDPANLLTKSVIAGITYPASGKYDYDHTRIGMV